MKENGLILYLESDKEAFCPPTIHHVHGLRDQRSGHNPRRSQLLVLAYADDVAQTAASERELADIMNVWQAAFNKYYLRFNLSKTEVTPNPKH